MHSSRYWPAMIAVAVALMLAPLTSARTGDAYHWARKRQTFALAVGNNLSGSWSGYLDAAVAGWNQMGTVQLAVVSGASDGTDCPPTAGMVQVCAAWYGTDVGWLGLTRLHLNPGGDHINAVTVQMNDSFLSAPGGRYNQESVRRHTMCHELGHALGLDHVTTASCMNDSQFAVFNYLTPTADDARALQRIYRHQDGDRTIALGVESDLSGFVATDGDSQASESVIVAPLTDEATVLTFVTWAAAEDPSGTAADGAAEQASEPDTSLAVIGQGSDAIDTDGDQVADDDELHRYGTDPASADTDGDGTLDGEELFGTGTDPLLWNASEATGTMPSADVALVVRDNDADNYSDALEPEIGLDPGNPDTDADGVADGDEITIYGTAPLVWDTDGDGVSDGTELYDTRTDPLIWDAGR